MGTKWKNIINKVVLQLKKGGKSLILCLVFMAVSLYLLYIMIHRRYYLSSKEVWRIGLPAIFTAAFALYFGLHRFLQHRYKSWIPKNENFYAEWKKTLGRQQKILILAGLLGLAAALFYFNSLIIYNNYGFYVGNFNYATGYMIILLALILFAVSEYTTMLFMKKQLDKLMICMGEINRNTVVKAIEAEKKSIDAAIKSEKLKVDLISNVSHDLKTPLTSIVGYIDLMKKETLNETMQDYVEVLSLKAEKLKEMIENLFSLAKTSSGNIELKPEPLHVNRLVEQIYADMEDKITNSGLEFVLDLTEQDTEIVNDSSYMYRICQNLMENALKYSAQNTRVFLKTAVEEQSATRKVRFEITNTSSYRMNFSKDQIVERFARADEARTSDGNGLGLAIVSTYTSALGGSFDVKIDCDQFKAILKFDKKPKSENDVLPEPKAKQPKSLPELIPD